jgi:hypothetical protein
MCFLIALLRATADVPADALSFHKGIIGTANKAILLDSAVLESRSNAAGWMGQCPAASSVSVFC